MTGRQQDCANCGHPLRSHSGGYPNTCPIFATYRAAKYTPPVVEEGRREAIASAAERVLIRAVMSGKVEGYTHPISLEIADAILALTPVSASPDTPKRPGFQDA